MSVIVPISATVRIAYDGPTVRVEQFTHADFGWERTWSANRYTEDDACERAVAEANALVDAEPYEYDPA